MKDDLSVEQSLAAFGGDKKRKAFTMKWVMIRRLTVVYVTSYKSFINLRHSKVYMKTYYFCLLHNPHNLLSSCDKIRGDGLFIWKHCRLLSKETLSINERFHKSLIMHRKCFRKCLLWHTIFFLSVLWAALRVWSFF
jgi:hypothetical protein